MKNNPSIGVMSLAAVATLWAVSSVHAAVPSDYGLKEGDTISAASTSDPDVYIVNAYGYKRLFLNPVIFSFYGHLGGFAKVKNVSAAARDAFPTSGLFRNCETNDQKVWAVEVTGEDTGTLHWVNMDGNTAVAQDPNFFKKVFCINNNEANWYTKSSVAYTSLSQVPVYTRSTTSSPSSTPVATATPVPTITPSPTSAPTPSPTSTPAPEPTLQSVSPTSLKYGNQFRMYGTGFLRNGVSQVQSIKVGPVSWLTTTATNIQDDGTIITTMQNSNLGTWDVSITSIDGTVITLPQAITITQ